MESDESSFRDAPMFIVSFILSNSKLYFSLWCIEPVWILGANQCCSVTFPPQLDRGEKI